MRGWGSRWREHPQRRFLTGIAQPGQPRGLNCLREHGLRFLTLKGQRCWDHIQLLWPEPQSLGPCTTSMKQSAYESHLTARWHPAQLRCGGREAGHLSRQCWRDPGPCSSTRGLWGINLQPSQFLGSVQALAVGLAITQGYASSWRKSQLGTWSWILLPRGSAGLEQGGLGSWLRCGSLFQDI